MIEVFRLVILLQDTLMLNTCAKGKGPASTFLNLEAFYLSWMLLLKSIL